MQTLRLFLTGFLLPTLIACQAQATATQSPMAPVPSSAAKNQSTVTRSVAASPTFSQAIACEDWQTWPVIPEVSQAARELYQRGQSTGNDSHAFSKIGDGEISTEWFFTRFDLREDYYNLGPYQNLAAVIEYFRGSFGRIGVAARRGFNTERILDPSLSDPKLCQSGESPLTCELRLHRPAFAILSLGTNQAWQPDEFERGMKQILDILVSKNVVPILSTKGDNLEGDYHINQTIVCLAQAYDVPLWNFWFAIQPLPDHGLQPDQEHLTYGIPNFGDSRAMQSAWTVRNLTALQTLDVVWRKVTTQP